MVCSVCMSVYKFNSLNQDNCSHKIRHDVIGPQTIEIVCQVGFKNTQRKSIAKIVCSILTDKKKSSLYSLYYIERTKKNLGSIKYTKCMGCNMLSYSETHLRHTK